jgi:hypothetical protein
LSNDEAEPLPDIEPIRAHGRMQDMEELGHIRDKVGNAKGNASLTRDQRFMHIRK